MVRANSGTCGKNLAWELKDDGTLTITGTGYMTNYSYISGSPWKANRSSITKVVIEEGVISIGDHAFYQCKNITDVKMPDSLELIGSSAFDSCSSITNMKIGNNVKSIKYEAFHFCTNLMNVSIGSNLASLETWVFYGCSSLISIEVEKSNTMFSSIDGVLFSDNKTVLVQYPRGKAGTNYTIPGHVKKIGYYAFYSSKLATVIIPDSVISIGNNAFESCKGLMNFKLPNRLERIDDCAFYGCNKLPNITLPKSLQYIGNRALCTRSSSMASIDVEYGNEYFKSVDGVLFIKNLTELIQYPPGKKDISNYVIPDSVKTIRISAFENSKLMNVTIPSGVKELNDDVFEHCEKLTCVVIPEGVQSIGGYTFGYCSNLGNITIPRSVTSIKSTAFWSSSNIKFVFYQGHNPLSSCTALTSRTNVCTPPGYTSDTFCGANVTTSSETCRTYQSFFTPCGRGSCVDGVVVEQKWDNVTTWERQTNECTEYHCDRVDGFVSRWSCNTSDEVRRVCVNEQCMDYEAINYDWSVEIDMINVTWNEVNETEIMEILSNLTGVNNMKIGTEADDKGNVVRIIIYVQDESMANILAETIKELDIGIFRKTVNVRKKCKNLWLSNGYHVFTNAFLLIFMMLLLASIL